MKSKFRVETIEEFLARGGEIKRYPMVGPDEEKHTIAVPSLTTADAARGNPSTLLAGAPPDKKKKQKATKIDLTLIPTALKEKLGIPGELNEL